MTSILLFAGVSAALEELVAQRREALRALAGDASDRVRGRLHLAIGLSLADLGESRLDEAIEEMRMALARLPEEEPRLDHAEARYHLGRLLLDRARRRLTSLRLLQERWRATARRRRQSRR